MTKKKRKIDWAKVRGILPYFVAAVVTLSVVVFGSLDKRNQDTSLSLSTFAAEDSRISVDQLSELYVVADLSNTLGLASAADVASNYVLTTSMYDAGQTTTVKIEKPAITNIAVSRGVVEHTVAEGETLDTIAAKYKVSTDQIDRKSVV